VFASAAQRRARLVARHHLDRSANDVVDAATALVGFHATSPASVYLSARARVRGFERSDLEEALYDDRTLVRVLGMRRTMFVVPTSLLPVIHNGATRALAARERRGVIDMIETAGIAADGRGWLESAGRRILAALASGPATAAELTRVIPELSERVTFSKADGTVQAVVGMSTRVLFLLAAEGKVIRARPRGTWRSGMYEWAPFSGWTGAPIGSLEPASARVRLLEAYLGAFGPVTEIDAAWWTGWPVTQVRAALRAFDAGEVDVDSGRGFVLPDDLRFDDDPRPSVALLPTLDATTMGWKERDWYLGSHAAPLFDRSGNAGPSVWLDGRVVGGWGVTPSGSVRWQLLEDIPRRRLGEIERAVADLETWLGGDSVAAGFRTPLEKRLSAGD
jgi:hypothetical protein